MARPLFVATQTAFPSLPADDSKDNLPPQEENEESEQFHLRKVPFATNQNDNNSNKQNQSYLHDHRQHRQRHHSSAQQNKINSEDDNKDYTCTYQDKHNMIMLWRLGMLQ